MGLIKYKFRKFWEIKKEIKTEGNVNCILYFEKNKLLYSIKKSIKLYDIEKDRNILNIDVHQREINDLLKINESIFISSSYKTIQFIELLNDFSFFIIIKRLDIHSNEINQTIKLKNDNFYATCSNDKKIKIFQFDYEKKDEGLITNILYDNSEVLSILELPNSNIVSISKKGYLNFWECKEFNYKKIKTLKGFKNSLHNCIYLLNEDIILIGTKNIIFLVDIITKETTQKILIDYSAYSIDQFNGNIFLGLKKNINSCLLYEYKHLKKFDKMNFECFSKGKDKCLEISFIKAIDEKMVVTSNKNSFIKIWKITEQKPKILKIENDPKYESEEEYDSEDETPGKDDYIYNKINNYEDDERDYI